MDRSGILKESFAIPPRGVSSHFGEFPMSGPTGGWFQIATTVELSSKHEKK
jgi:hypothetical protein